MEGVSHIGTGSVPNKRNVANEHKIQLRPGWKSPKKKGIRSHLVPWYIVKDFEMGSCVKDLLK